VSARFVSLGSLNDRVQIWSSSEGAFRLAALAQRTGAVWSSSEERGD